MLKKWKKDLEAELLWHSSVEIEISVVAVV